MHNRVDGYISANYTQWLQATNMADQTLEEATRDTSEGAFRMAKERHGVEDIRDMYTNDIRFLEQFP